MQQLSLRLILKSRPDYHSTRKFSVFVHGGHTQPAVTLEGNTYAAEGVHGLCR
jgi:hypothetical protein